MSNDFIRNPFLASLNEIRSSWGWFFAGGIALVLFGTICVFGNIAATFATVLVVGWFLFASGVVALVHAFQVRNWGGFFLFFLSALLRGFAGYVLIRYPFAGALTLTLVLALFFVVSGVFRTVVSAMMTLPGRGWSVFSGLVTLALGVMLLAQMPVSSMWFLGFAVGMEMIFEGASFIRMAVALKSLPKTTFARAQAA